MPPGELKERVEPGFTDQELPPLDPGRATAANEAPAPASRQRTLSLGLLASLLIHLSPLLLLLGWSSAPAEPAVAIPIRLVLEEPPPPPPPPPVPEPKPPGRLASVDMGKSGKEARRDPPTPDEAASDLVSALPKPTVPAEPLGAAPAEAEPPPPKPAPKRLAAALAPPKPHPAPVQVPGPAATRDEYLAYVSALINRHSDMLAPSLIAGRSGVAVISILVLGDGTIARIAIKRGSGHPDIDGRIEQMVAAVGRFPPLPQWIQAPSVLLDYHRVFPERIREH